VIIGLAFDYIVGKFMLSQQCISGDGFAVNRDVASGSGRLIAISLVCFSSSLTHENYMVWFAEQGLHYVE
jgi:hypothetical protein